MDFLKLKIKIGVVASEIGKCLINATNKHKCLIRTQSNEVIIKQ